MIRLVCARGLAVVPALFSSISILTFIVTYIIAVSNNDLYPYFPTISQSGVKQPERNIFTLFLSLASFLGMATVIIRFVQVKFSADCVHLYHRVVPRLNIASFVIGLASCFGALMVASFQGQGWSQTGHMIGASLTFGGGLLYCWLQCFISYKFLHSGILLPFNVIARFAIAALGTISFLACIICMVLSYSQWNEHQRERTDYQNWKPKDPGYAEHVVSAASEWITSVLLLSFFCLFCGEFQRVGFEFKVRSRDTSHISFYTSSSDIESPFI